MTAPKFITLEAWLAENYGEAVTIETGRRWCRTHHITPAPQKHGRTYFLAHDARYTDARHDARPRLLSRILDAAKAA